MEVRLQEIQERMVAAGFQITATELAVGFLKIANNNMAAAIRVVSIAKGYDPADYALVSFGGAGSQHCCSLARILGMQRIVDHPQGSILSAIGIRLADQAANRVRSVLQTLDEGSLVSARRMMGEMAAEIRDELISDFDEEVEVVFQNSLDLRYVGTESFETIAESELDYREAFSQVHQRRYGYTQDRPIEIVAARCVGKIEGNRLPKVKRPETTRRVESNDQQRMFVPQADDRAEYEERSVAVFDRSRLNQGDQIVGPAIVFNPLSSTIVDSGWQVTVLGDGQLIMERVKSTSGGNCQPDIVDDLSVDPVELEIFNNHFSTIARQMGLSLQNTSCLLYTSDAADE